MELEDGTRRYLAGAVAARTGDSMGGPALLLAGLAITRSAASASALLGTVLVSAMIGAPVFGILLDRSRRPGRLLAGALAAFAAALVLMLAGLGVLPLPMVLAIALPAGLLGPALSGGWTSQLPMVAGARSLPRAMALDAMTYDVAGLIGPALAGFVAELVGACAAVIVSAALIGLAIPAAVRLPDRRHPTIPFRARPATDLVAGFRAITGNRPLRRATLVTVTSSLGEGMFVTCCPFLGSHALGGATRGAYLLSVVALAGIAANALLMRKPTSLRPDTVIGLSPAFLAVGALLAATGTPFLVIPAVALIGAAEGPQLTALFAIRHREAPEQLRGQVFTSGAPLRTPSVHLWPVSWPRAPSWRRC
ncbi:MFS family permease [Streptacidiphilus sp. MAP12-33]|uniref:MFS transporter n=1 Tax=Streptacidiphilus sp. MAP12-33 TaxID=3156266 RepID=UPI00351267C0